LVPEVIVLSSKLRSALAVGAVTGGLVLAAPASAMAAGTVTGTVSCYWTNADGSVTVSVGYNNTTGSTQTIPVGSNNYVSPSPADQGQPTVFLPGVHDNVWAPTITPSEMSSGSANWFVDGNSVSATTFNQCATKPVSVNGSTAGYLTATSAVVGLGLYVIASPRRRRALTRRRSAVTPASSA
jgi:hypothetical protein